jgi:hypothetical protein
MMAMAPETPDPQLPEQLAADPSQEADTGAPGASETAADTQGSADTWEQRYRALQAAYTKARMELAEVRRQLGQGPPQDAAPEPEAGPSDAEAEYYRQLWEQSEWARAEAIYGPEVIGAYDAFYRVYETDPTPTGVIAALEAYHQARSSGATVAQANAAAAAAAQQPQQVPPQPSPVDRNVPAAAPDLDNAIAEAKAKGDLIGWLRARRQQVGL